MNNKRQNESKDLTEKQIIRDYHYKKFKEQYPQYEENYSIPKPKTPSTLDNVDLSRKKMANIKIKEPQKSILCGTCLADSSLRLQKGYANARIQCRHSTRQASWFFWKWTVCLRDYTNGIDSITFQKPDGYQMKSPVCESKNELLGKLKVSSRAMPELTELHSIICENNKEKIERHWLNHMTDYFLMAIWLDDGSLYNKRQGVICLDSSPADEQKVFVDYLKTIWNIDAYVRKTDHMMKNQKYVHRIYIKDMDSLLRLLRIVAPLIPVKEMLYKVMFVPINDSDLLQRWASEVSDLVLPEFRQYMKDEYQKIINNYKNGCLNESYSEEDIVQL